MKIINKFLKFIFKNYNKIYIDGMIIVLITNISFSKIKLKKFFYSLFL